VTAAEFIDIRGEFKAVFQRDPTRVTAALAAAERQTDATLFKDDRAEAVMWLAAHILAADPLGKDARIIGKKAMPLEAGTLYMQERARLEALYGAAYGVGPGSE
jgi:hypothetical protein